MRPKVLLSVVVLALAILAPAIYFHFKPASQPSASADQSATVTGDAAAPTTGTPSLLKRMQGHSQESGPVTSPSESNPAMSHEEYVVHRKAELAELGMQNDPDSLKTILSELENPNAEIRAAALNATIDFGGQDAIPTLQKELSWATDPQEKLDIQKAIDFLQIPTIDTGDNGSITQQSADGSAPATN